MAVSLTHPKYYRFSRGTAEGHSGSALQQDTPTLDCTAKPSSSQKLKEARRRMRSNIRDVFTHYKKRSGRWKAATYMSWTQDGNTTAAQSSAGSPPLPVLINFDIFFETVFSAVCVCVSCYNSLKRHFHKVHDAIVTYPSMVNWRNVQGNDKMWNNKHSLQSAIKCNKIYK